MLTVDDVKDLHSGKILYHKTKLDSRGNPLECRVSGKCKLWKTRPKAFKLPVKHGLYQCFYIDNVDYYNWKDWALTQEDAIYHIEDIKQDMKDDGKINLYMRSPSIFDINIYFKELSEKTGKQYITKPFIEIITTNGKGHAVMFRAFQSYTSRHNWHRLRKTHMWFMGPDGFVWYGTNLGDNEIVRCKRTKKTKL